MSYTFQEELRNELDKYLQNGSGFLAYYPDMNILSSELYRKQLKEASRFVKENTEMHVRSYEIYLDTIIINMHTKAKKYKQSIYFNDENVKEIQNQGFTIPFYTDEKRGLYILLGIVKSEIIE